MTKNPETHIIRYTVDHLVTREDGDVGRMVRDVREHQKITTEELAGRIGMDAGLPAKPGRRKNSFFSLGTVENCPHFQSARLCAVFPD